MDVQNQNSWTYIARKTNQSCCEGLHLSVLRFSIQRYSVLNLSLALTVRMIQEPNKSNIYSTRHHLLGFLAIKLYFMCSFHQAVAKGQQIRVLHNESNQSNRISSLPHWW
jgi:hypothetical protein